MNQYLMNHLKSLETVPRHTEQSRRIREAVEVYIETRDIRPLLRLQYFERKAALEILHDEVPDNQLSLLI